MRRLAACSIALLIALTSAPGTASAAAANRLDVVRPATLNADGTVDVRLRARCDPGLEVLEALVTVSQDAAFGDSGLGVTCDGRNHRVRVTVSSFDAPFVRGAAQVSTLLLLLVPGTGETVQAQDTERLRLRARR